MAEFLANFLVISILILIIVFIAKTSFANANRDIRKTVADNYEKSGFLSYDTVHNILIIRKQFSGIINVLKIEDHVNTVTAHKPTEYIYTSATVGGITTGGVTKTGRYDYLVSTGKSGKCLLVYGADHPVMKIQLSDELYQKALKSDIKEYLNNEKQIVVVKPYTPYGLEADALKAMVTSGRISLASDMLANRADYPTRDKCTRILNWLCSKE